MKLSKDVLAFLTLICCVLRTAECDYLNILVGPDAQLHNGFGEHARLGKLADLDISHFRVNQRQG